MPLDPQIAALLSEAAAQGAVPFAEMSIPQARDGAFREGMGETEEVAEVRDLLVPGSAGELPVRLYVPGVEGPLPLLVFFHGGGWVLGNIEIADRPCRALANATGCIVASVEYRLSPETKFPGAPEDCYAATKWIVDHAEGLGSRSDLIGVAGDSAGGNLAAAVTLMARDRGGPRIAYQLLLYPAMAPERNSRFPSYTECAEGYGLTRRDMAWFWGHYLSNDTDGENPYASPLKAQDLSGLPPATVVTCEFDVLRDEGEAYADRLRAADVSVRLLPQAGMIHGFLWLGGFVDHVELLLQTLASEISAAFAKSVERASSMP